VKTIHAADVDASATLPQRCYQSDKTAFYSNHITVSGPIATSFLKSKALPNIDWEKKKHL